MATLARLKFGYNKKYTPEEQQQIIDLAFTADFRVSNEDTHLWMPITMLVEDAMKFGTFEVMEILPYHITDRISTFQQRNGSAFNEKCNVTVGGLGTLSIDEVKVELDCCSDALQRKLDDGWRILAVCVQPDQRRPDYVLGRTNYKT